ncbi:MAG: hypothetical protein JNL10_17975 [Verrucomicrobiales bacterium]|nr:hypothetical protein [Verrucomicrobiales bacterium]
MKTPTVFTTVSRSVVRGILPSAGRSWPWGAVCLFAVILTVRGAEAISREITIHAPSPAEVSPPPEAISREVTVFAPRLIGVPSAPEAISREITIYSPRIPLPPPLSEAISREISIEADPWIPEITRLPADFRSGTLRFEWLADTRPTNPDRLDLPADISLGPLEDRGTMTIPWGGNTIITGPAFLRPGNYPGIQLDESRLWTVLHPAPELLGASLGVPIQKGGEYLIRGRFARANDLPRIGNGVSVAVIRNLDTTNLLFTAAIGSDHEVPPGNPFNGTGVVEFSLAAAFSPGDVVRFVVFAGAAGRDVEYDLTALEATVVLREDAPGVFENGPPFIALQPASLSRRLDESARFDVLAYGLQPLTFQWYRDQSVRSGETAPSLTWTGVQAADAGTYSVLVENPLGRVLSSPARLDVLVTPEITRDPAPLTVRSGADASFSVGATGSEPLHFDWRFNGASLHAPDQPELRLPGVTSGSSGFISVRVTNAAGFADSRAAELRVVEPARLAQPLAPLTQVPLDGGFLLSVGVSGTAPFDVQWRLNGQDIPGANDLEYRVNPVGIEHAGIYSVVVANEAGAITGGPAEVRVEIPEFPGSDAFSSAADLSSQKGPLGGSTVRTTHEPGEPSHAGKPGNRSVWYRWTAPGDGRVSFRTVGSAFDTLLAAYTGSRIDQLTEIASNDDAAGGAYFASEIRFSVQGGTTYSLAIDGLGDDSGNYILSWLFESRAPAVPRITAQPRSQSQLRGQPITLRVEAEEATGIQWEFNGRTLAGAAGATVEIAALEPENVGTYVAVVQGAGGTVFSHPAVIEIGPQPEARSFDKEAELGGGTASPEGRVNRQSEGGLGLLLSPGRPVEQWVNNEVNTTQGSEANHCDFLIRRTGWMLLEVERDGHLVVTATNTTVPLILALYGFSDPDVPLACSQGNRLVLPDARAGRIYSLVFGSTADVGGLIELVCVSGTPPPPPLPPGPVTEVEPGRGVTLVAPTVSGLQPDARYQWFRNGRAIDGARDRALVLDRFTLELAGDYSVVLDNGVGRTEFVIGTLQPDLPLQPAGAPETANGVFIFRLTGNAGQRVAVDRGTDLGVWNTHEEFWLPATGLEYRDDSMATRSRQLFSLSEVPIHIREESPLDDGRRTWRVHGGRLGSRYVLEQSVDGIQWTPVRTNRVEEGPFLHIGSADSPATSRVRIQPGNSPQPF